MAFDANDLSEFESFAIERTRVGEVADFSSITAQGGARPALRAGFLRKLLLCLEPSWAIQLPGVRIKGARIEGALDLADCLGASGAGLPALCLEHCDVPEIIDVRRARFSRLSVNHSRIVGVNGHGCAVVSALSFDSVTPLAEGEGAEAWLCFRDAEIGGDCSGRAAHIAMGARTLDGVRPFTPLDLEGARIAGHLHLDGHFVAHGCVLIKNSRIGGSVSIVGDLAHAADDRRRLALAAQNADIGGDFSAHDRTRDLKVRSGRITFKGAVIGKDLDLRGLEVAGGEGVDASNVCTRGGALFTAANIKGLVNLAGARIDGDLMFGGGRFINPGNWAIQAANARVGGNVKLVVDPGFAPHGHKTVVEGGLLLEGATIGGALSWATLELRGTGPDGAKGAILSVEGASIAGPLQASALSAHAAGHIDLAGATCSALDDDLKSGWGEAATTIDLEGFTYSRLDNPDEKWRQRLAWLKRADGRFSPQPYAQVAKAYARAGRRDDARRILLAHRDQRTLFASGGPITWLLSSLFGLIAGYGLAPIRILRALVLFIAIGVVGVFAMNAQGALVAPDGRQCAGAVEPALYAIDVALPLIDLGQGSRCAPGRTARAELPAGTELSALSDWRLFEGVAIWRWAHALYALLGAILTALAVITFSGVLKPRE
jgi:hypothetical protein